MCKSKRSRLLCLLFALIFCFQSFGLGVSAADSENLIDSDLNNWIDGSEIDSNIIDEVFVIQEGNLFALRYTILDPGVYGIWLGGIIDKTDLIVGNEYSLSFYLPSYNDLPSRFNFISEALFNAPYEKGSFYVGLAYIQNGHFVLDENNKIEVNSENYINIIGSQCSITFTLGDYVGTPCVLIYSGGSYSNSTYYYNFISDVSLVNNTQSKEDGFFAKLFEWFEKKFNSIGESFSNLGNKLTDLKDGFVNKITELKDSFVEKIESLKQSFIDLGNNILEGIKNLFVPDEQYILDWKQDLDDLLKEHLGIIYTCSELFTETMQLAFDIIFEAPDTYEIKIPEVSFKANGTTVPVFSSQNIDFSFMEEPVFKTMYGMYTVALYFFFGALEVNYALRVYRKVMSN